MKAGFIAGLICLNIVFAPGSAVAYPILSPGDSETEGWTELHFAAANGQVDNAAKLLGQHADVDVQNARGRTPLYEAAKRGRLEVVKLLVEKGAKIDAHDAVSGFVPLHIASEQKHADVVKYLLDKGAPVDTRNKSEQTPLWQAAWQPWHRDDEIAAVLIEHGANVNARDDKGFTPLHMAALTGHLPVVRLLLSKRAQVDAKSTKGASPLYKAAEAGQLETVSVLLGSGADVNADFQGWTPLKIAVTKGHGAVADLLKRHGAR